MKPMLPCWTATLDEYPTSLSLSHDGSLVAVGTAAGTVSIFNSKTGALLNLHSAHEHGVLAVAFGSKALATAGSDGCARLWGIKSGEVLAELPGNSAWVSHLQWSADGKRLATAGGAYAQIWSSVGDLIACTPKLPATINGIAFNPVGGLLAAAIGSKVAIIRGYDGLVDRTLSWNSTLLNMAWNNDGKILACGSIDKSVHFWRTSNWQDSRMGGYSKKPQVLRFSADGKRLATTGHDDIMVWDFSGRGPEGSEPWQLAGHASPATTLCMHPKNAELFSADAYGRVLRWQLTNQGELHGTCSVGSAAADIACSANQLFVTTAAGELRVFNL